MTIIDQVIANARNEIGKPYIFGDEGPNSFDCSGLMQWIWGKVGIKLPRLARQQQDFVTTIPASQRLPGDLIFWGDPAHHVALYIGDGKMISAPGRGQKVHLVKVSGNVTYGRVPGGGAATSGITGAVGDAVGWAGDLGDKVLAGGKSLVLEGLFIALGAGLVVLGLWKGVRRTSMLDKAERLVS